MSRPDDVRATGLRPAHAVVATAALVAVVWQLALVVQGASVLDETARPDLPTRLARFVSYFTVLSNVLVVVVSGGLAADPLRDGRTWRVVHLASLVGITVTGVVHWFLLRPILDLSGASYAVDKLLHVVVPALAVAVWLWFGPRGRVTPPSLLPTLVWPALWGGFTIVRGLVTDWWPYPFIDLDALGWGRVLGNLLGVAVLFTLVGATYVAVDGVLTRRANPVHPPVGQ